MRSMRQVHHSHCQCSIVLTDPLSLSSCPFSGTSTSSFINRGNVSSNFGFDHMAAALLAMEHFNERNTTVVPELADFLDCPIQFDMNNSLFFDSDAQSHAAVQELARQSQTPCAIPEHRITEGDLAPLPEPLMIFRRSTWAPWQRPTCTHKLPIKPTICALAAKSLRPLPVKFIPA